MTAALLVIDVQERLAPAIPAAAATIRRIAGLLDAARQARLPILATEQYSRRLGPTVEELRQRLADGEVFEKISFAAPREPVFPAALESRGLRRAFVAGLAAHACVQPRVLALRRSE